MAREQRGKRGQYVRSTLETADDDLPENRGGWLAIALVGTHALFVFLFLGLIIGGQEGGDTFFANPWLAWTALPAGVFGIGAGLTALHAVLRRGERAVLTYVVVLFAVGLAAVIVTEIAHSQ